MNFDEINDRKGTYCTQWDYIEDRFGKSGLLPFSISDTDFKIPEPITKQLEKILEHQIFGYTRWNHDDFKGSIQGFFQRRFDCHIEKDWVVYSPSVIYSVSVLLRLLSQDNDTVLCFNPMYDAFFNVVEKNKRNLISCHLNNETFQIDFHDFENKIKDCQVLLLCSPHNPTGRVWTSEELQHIIKICQKYQVKIISDEIHMDVILTNRKHQPILKYLSQYNQLYLVSSSSKTMNTPGLGGSYAIIPNQEIKKQFLIQTKEKDFVNSANIMGMHACMVGYTQCDNYIDQLVDYIKGNMRYVETYLKENIPDFTFHIPESTYLAWIDVRKAPFSMDEIQKAFIEIGEVAIMDGKVYGDNGIGFLRMNCGCPRSKLEEGLKRMKKAMDALYQRKQR
ncbi:MalY/PatB family protein [Candidatus Stoquefichus massiliensis]|uniref:MalY/PatB family protein n=1 Tax=Candidatus Stoquefichus massiliensis TaxID=1470350 RepID=UPI0004B504A4|nr:PatB family C-S lyase [Candidatus Stoquefichus massiliensis]